MPYRGGNGSGQGVPGPPGPPGPAGPPGPPGPPGNGGGESGGSLSSIVINGTEFVAGDDANAVAITFTGRVRCHPDAENNRIQIEVLDADGGTTGSDPDREVGWGNWPVGDMRFLPGLAIPPPGTVLCDGSWYASNSYPEASASPHVSIDETRINADVTGTVTISEDGKYWGHQDGFRYTHCQHNAGAGATYRATYASTPGTTLALNRQAITPFQYYPWLDAWWMLLFPTGGRGRLVSSYRTRFPLAARTGQDATGNGGTATGVNAGVDGWELYGLTEADGEDNPDHWQLIDEQTRVTGCSTANWTYYNRFPIRPEHIRPLWGIKLVVKGNRLSGKPEPYPASQGVVAGADLSQLWFYEPGVFRVPSLPRENDGVAGIWCIRLKDAP